MYTDYMYCRGTYVPDVRVPPFCEWKLELAVVVLCSSESSSTGSRPTTQLRMLPQAGTLPTTATRRTRTRPHISSYVPTD
eukprot:COSAG02_NODE_616_length_19505_cov_5.004998_9_plen_80_part_00